MPPVRFWVGCALWLSAWRLARSLAWARLSCLVQLRRLWPPVRGWGGCAALTGVGARPSSYAGASILPGAAAAAMPPVRCEVGCAIGFGSGAWRVSRVGADSLTGAAAAAMPPVRVWVGCALGFGLDAWPRGCAADTPDIAALFPLTNNRPLSEGAAGASRLGEGWCTRLSLRLR